MFNIVTFRELTGGIATFTKHLIGALGGMNHVELLKVGKVRRKSMIYSGLSLRGVLPEDVVDRPTLVLLNPEDEQEISAIRLMGRIPCVLVHHCRTSVLGGKVADMSGYAKQIVVIRQVLLDLFTEPMSPAGSKANKAIYLRHPYMRSRPVIQKTRLAISHSQVVPKKGHDIMLLANRLLPADKQIEIWGTGNNFHRFYVHHVLSKKFPEYVPRPYDDAMPLVASAIYDIDLTDFPSDGGGTQYTFLEAADGGAIPILRKSWFSVNGDLENGLNALAIEKPEDLVTILTQRDSAQFVSIVRNNRELLTRHDGSEWLCLMSGYR